MKERLYLAGPEVFLPNMAEVRDTKLEICALYGFIGDFPIDGEPLPSLPAKQLGKYICRKNKIKIKTSQAVIANITPFRGVSADVGTAFEIGFADAINRPIFGYTNNPHLFVSRNLWAFNGKNNGDGTFVDNSGIMIESFNMADNLMIDSAILDSTHTLIVSTKERELDDLTLFEQTVKKAWEYFNEKDCQAF